MSQKAPGKDFRDGLSLVKFAAMFADDAAAQVWFVQTRWPNGPHCPYCGSINVLSGAKHKTMPYRCREKECRKRFSVRTKTPLDSSNLRISSLGDCDLSLDDQPQGRLKHEAASRCLGSRKARHGTLDTGCAKDGRISTCRLRGRSRLTRLTSAVRK